jgi:hypothetical protein
MEFYLYSLLGLVYYIVVYLLSQKFKFKMIHGLWLPLLLNLGIIGMLIYSSNSDTTGWAALGYFVLLILGLGILLIYLLSWGVHSLIRKNRSNI